MRPHRFVTPMMALTVALSALACKKSEDTSAEPAASAVPAESLAEPVPPAPAAEPENIPTEEDYEQKAQATITEKNLEATLDELEKEIGP